MEVVNQASQGRKNGRSAAQGAIRGAVFDLDGVLMDTEWIAFLVWREVTERHHGRLADEHYPAMIGLTAEETGEYVMQKAGVRFPLESTVAWVWQQVTNRINAGIQPLPGSVELVSTLAARGLPLAIASNSPTSYIVNALNGLGLRDYFQETVGVDQVTQGKPAPDVYLRAAEKLGVSAEQCLAVEDSRVGAQAALRAGMRVLAVPSPHDDPRYFQHCYGIYHSLSDVHAIIDEVLER